MPSTLCYHRGVVTGDANRPCHSLTFTQEFGIAPVEGDPAETEKNEWLVVSTSFDLHQKAGCWLIDTCPQGVINAGPYLASAFCGCWLSDPCNYFLGRRGAIFISAIFCIFPVLAQGLTQTWEQLFVCRILMGIGEQETNQYARVLA